MGPDSPRQSLDQGPAFAAAALPSDTYDFAGDHHTFETLESRLPVSGPSLSTHQSQAVPSSSLSSSVSGNPAFRASRLAQPGTAESHAERASLSMPPPLSRPIRIPQSSLSHTRRERASSDAMSEDLSSVSLHKEEGGPLHSSSRDNDANADADADADATDSSTPRLAPGTNVSGTRHQHLPEPALPSSRNSLSDDAKRLSVTSIYSLASARGVPSSAGSEKGSDSSSVVHRVVSGLVPMASSTGKGLGSGSGRSQSEAGVSDVTITTGSQGSEGVYLSPRDAHHHLGELVKRNTVPITRSEASSVTSAPRSVPTRSRSRAKRRFSGSTATSSHSPSSDRVQHKREKEEPRPAPLGVIGVCALDVKARSKPSRNILNRLIQNNEFDVIVFGDKVILDEAVENWPICDYLISFYSDGFPLEKAIAYVKARKPFCVNDVPMQKILWDRRVCLRLLDRIGVLTPQRIEVNRDGGPKILTPDIVKHIKDVSGITLESTEPDKFKAPRKVELLDDGDILSVDGKLLKKPFVEKPTSGEDHNIIIYFPNVTGGGARKLFRKIGNKSSEYVEDLVTPRAITQPGESFVYEKFMRVDNAEDVKAYTVGPQYCHAETRKSPVVDGVVRRNTHGKEIRYVTGLNSEEKEVASKISTTFGQRVCGFDFLRAGGKSYVIDVNGWSFVKDNDEYYAHCSNILRKMFIEERMRRGGATPPIPSPAPSEVDPMSQRVIIPKDKDAQLSAALTHQSKSTASVAGVVNETQGGDPKSLAPSFAEVSPKSDSALISTLQRTVSIPMSQVTGALVGSLPTTAPSTVPTTPNLLDAARETHPEETPPPPPPTHAWRLKGMVSVIRHADRTPKQKYKFTFHTDPFIELLKGHQEEVLLIGDAALASVANAVDVAMQEGVEDRGKLRALRNVLIKKGTWPGTKVQIKPMFRKKKTDEMTTLEEGKPETTTPPIVEDKGDQVDQTDGQGSEYKPRIPPKRHDSLSGVTMSKFTAAENSLVLDKLQLIVKWGGEPTHSARYQAQELGESMRNDLLLMNRDVLDEVHVYSSSERRVTTSAQIWAASFLAEKDLAEDFITIRKDLLDDSNAAKDEMDKVKKKLKGLLRKGNERPPQFAWPDNMPEPSEVQTRVVQLMNFHRRVMQHNYAKLHGGAVGSLNAISNPSAEKLTGHVHEGTASPSMGSLAQANAINNIQPRWCCGEDTDLFRERWEKLFEEFCDAEKVDPSKISELYDTMKFDALHNRAFLEWVFTPPKHMLDEEWGSLLPSKEAKDSKAADKESKATDKDAEEGKSSEDSKAGKAHSVHSMHSAHEEKDSSPKSDRSEPNKTVKRIFRRRSWMSGFRHGVETAAPEQYFNLYTGKGNSKTKAKTDARLEPLRELYQLAKVMFDFICPQEYGISDSEKLEIGLLTSLPLLKEVVQDLEEMQASDEAKAFFYFTKESHIYTLLNCILEGGIETKIQRSTIPELDYLSQICFELYESETKPKAAPTGTVAGVVGLPTYEYSIRITLSPGCHVYDPLDIQLDSRHCISCAPRRSLTPHGNWKKVIETLRARFHQVSLPKSFLAVNLSDAFSFQEKQSSNESEGLEMKPLKRAAASNPAEGLGIE